MAKPTRATYPRKIGNRLMEIDTIFRRVKRLRSVGSMRHTVDHQINPSVVGSHLHSNLQWPFRCCNHLCSRVEEFTQRPTADSIDTNLFFECFICAPVELYCLMCTVCLSNKNTQAITFVHDNIDFARSENDRRKFYQSFPNFNELDSLVWIRAEKAHMYCELAQRRRRN